MGTSVGIEAPPMAGEASFAERKLNIVHITPSLSPHVGGPATVAMHLAAAQAVLGHEVGIISCLHQRDRAAFEKAAGAVRDFDRVHLQLRPWPGVRKRFFGTRMIPLYRRMIPSADVVHIHGVWEPMLLLAGAYARAHGVPYFVRPCGMLDSWSLSQRSVKKRLALWVAHRRLLKGAANIHVLTPEEAAAVNELETGTPLVTITNGVDLQEIEDEAGDAIYARAPALRGKPYMLFLGRLHYKKGLKLLAEIFARVARLMPELQLLVVGPDNGEEAVFQETIRRLGVADRVHLTGALEGAEKHSAFRNAALFCLPSQQEGFSNAVIEAMAASVPVAISTECHFPEVERIHAGRVFPLRIEAAVEAVYGLLSKSTEQRRNMGAAGRMYVESRHTWRHVAERTLAAYAAVIAEPRGQKKAGNRAAVRTLRRETAAV